MTVASSFPDDACSTPNKGNIGYELAPGIKRFLANFRDPEMQTLQDVVDFGRAHAPKELPEGETPCDL